MASRLTFYINFDEDLRYVLGRITHLDPAGIDYRIEQKGFDKNVILSVLKTKDKTEQKEVFTKYLKSFYKENEDNLRYVRDKYNEIWSEKSEYFFKTIRELMGEIDWKFENYSFLVSSFYSKASWGTSNNFAVWWKRDPATKHHMNAYELTLSHVFETIDKIYNKRPVEADKIWAIAEITAYFYVYREDKVASVLWPWIKDRAQKESAYDYFYNGSYKQLGKPAQDLYNIYTKKLPYKEYLKESIQIIDNYAVDYLNNPL
jgi:hypothetical protein